MCQQCVDLVKKYYPKLNPTECGRLLMNATAFPFCPPDDLEKQLQELRENTDGTVDDALRYADGIFDEMYPYNHNLSRGEKNEKKANEQK